MSCLNDSCGKILKLKIAYERELRLARLIIRINFILTLMDAVVLVISYYKPDRLIAMYVMIGGTIIVNLIYLFKRMVSK